MTRRIPRSLLLAALPTLIAGLLIVAWPRTTRVSVRGIAFDIPSGWSVHDKIPPSTGPGAILALVGNMHWGPCDQYDINCHFQERFNQGEIEIQVRTSFLLGSDFCAYAHERADLAPRTDGIRVTETHYIRIDGRPAISTYYSVASADYYLSDGWREWNIGTSDGMYSIHARWRGPGDDEFIAALDRLVASISFEQDQAVDATAADCGDPFPPARSLSPGETPTPAPTPSPTAEPVAQIDCTAEAGPLPLALQGDPCPDAITAVELAVAPERLAISRIVIEPGPFYCDLVWPGGQTLTPCRPVAALPGQFMHGWVWFRDSNKVAAVVLGLDLPDDLNQPGATRPPWHTTLAAFEVPPPGFVVQ